MTESVGQKLLEARTNRGISLEEAARATRIRSHFLKALEADDLASLPSPAHFRGFLRLYADYLGIDQAELNLVIAPPKATVKTTTIKAKAKRSVEPAKAVEDYPPPQPATEPTVVMMEKARAENPEPDSPAETNPANDSSVPAEIPPTATPVTVVKASPIPAKKSFLKLPTRKPKTAASVEKLPKTPGRAAAQEDEEEEETQKTSQEMIIEIGHTLRKQREMLNLSLDEVEHFTRLKLHHLKTLESGRVEDLASPVQARGMLSNYARFLNLDDEKILLAFAEALQARRLERLETNPGAKSEAKTVSGPGIRRFLSIDLILGSLIIIGMFGFLVWGLSQVADSQKQQAAQSTLPSVAQILGASPTNTPGSVTPAGPATTQTPDLTGGQAVQPAAGDLATTTPPAGKQANAAGTPASVTQSAPTGPIQVYVVARNSAWMRVLSDGKEVFIGRVIPGNAYTYAANKQLEVISGNAAALQILFNQNDLGSLGVVDQVIDLIFTSKGLVAPTATITPSPTKVLTPTPGAPITETPPAPGATAAPTNETAPTKAAPTVPAKNTPVPTTVGKPTATPTY